MLDAPASKLTAVTLLFANHSADDTTGVHSNGEFHDAGKYSQQ
jgi:hypothetical protein